MIKQVKITPGQALSNNGNIRKIRKRDGKEDILQLRTYNSMIFKWFILPVSMDKSVYEYDLGLSPYYVNDSMYISVYGPLKFVCRNLGFKEHTSYWSATVQYFKLKYVLQGKCSSVCALGTVHALLTLLNDRHFHPARKYIPHVSTTLRG
ncbi:hypothetical protein P167DRAFT_544849 [Morchella conica CCBAS932]|uniref:Uncharacterized protein n=1 Tax=Morchella conica CCBAS932 TaxID=1392247 RepID=A0A3N4KRE5_9PEZI|nr:hypothetical protein P167DRAFT_544849 [Morchella conica CCBAS932]